MQPSQPQWTNQTNLTQAIRLKQQGNKYFKQKNYKSALKNYHQAILHLGGIIDKSSSMAMYTKTASEQISNEANLLKYSIWLNMCQIYIFQEKYEKCLDTLKKCQQLLNNQQFPLTYNKNTNRPKLHYRKGICFMKLNYFQQAKAQFNKLKQLDSSFNKEIQQFEQEIKIKQKNKIKKQKKCIRVSLNEINNLKKIEKNQRDHELYQQLIFVYMQKLYVKVYMQKSYILKFICKKLYLKFNIIKI